MDSVTPKLKMDFVIPKKRVIEEHISQPGTKNRAKRLKSMKYDDATNNAADTNHK